MTATEKDMHDLTLESMLAEAEHEDERRMFFVAMLAAAVSGAIAGALIALLFWWVLG